MEFLDFEWKHAGQRSRSSSSCGRSTGDRVNFVVRYFPIPAHFNAERAARAVESAAQQGKFEPMYKKMYETQSQWENRRRQQTRHSGGVFATELGLDMTKFDAAYNDPATVARINQDVADGKALGVDGTPTMFLDGKRLKYKSYSDLSSAIDQALQR